MLLLLLLLLLSVLLKLVVGVVINYDDIVTGKGDFLDLWVHFVIDNGKASKGATVQGVDLPARRVGMRRG